MGVGQDHVHYKVLTKIFLLNIVILSVESNKSRNNGCTVIIKVLVIIIIIIIIVIDDYCYYTVNMKVVTTTHHHHCKSNYSIMVEFFNRDSHHVNSKLSGIEICIAPQCAPSCTFVQRLFSSREIFLVLTQYSIRIHTS